MTASQVILDNVIFWVIIAPPVVIAVCILKGLEMYRRKKPNAVIFRVAQKTEDAIEKNSWKVLVTGFKWTGISLGVLLMAGLVIWAWARIFSSVSLPMIIIILLLVGIFANTMKR
jgi:hypothetical protein